MSTATADSAPCFVLPGRDACESIHHLGRCAAYLHRNAVSVMQLPFAIAAAAAGHDQPERVFVFVSW